MSAALEKALEALLEQWDAFEASVGNQEEAYYKLAKYARPKWNAARSALASLSSPQAPGAEPVASPQVEAHPLARFGSESVADLGLYRVHWKSGGSSLAAIGMMESGDRWIAPTNWTRPGTIASADEWHEIDRLEPIHENSPPPASAGVRVKALEWEEVTAARSNEDPTREPTGDYLAVSSIGVYYIEQYFGSDSYGWCVTLHGSHDVADKDDPEAAKAAAQADYERRILSALELSAQPSPSPVGGEDWRDDPSADDRWNAGLDYGQTQLCELLGVDPANVSRDAATETLDGDVKSVIGNILTARFGDNWRAALTSPADLPAPPATNRYCTCQNSKTHPCVMCGRPKFIDPEWLKRKIEQDPDEGEIGAGFELFSAPPATGESVTEELWALCYLHDWDPPKEGQEHKWEPGKNVFPEVHAFYRSWRDAEAIRATMSTPDRYWVVRARPEDEARLTAALALPQQGWRATHRHKKRGGEYTLLGIGKMQAQDWGRINYGDGKEEPWWVPVDMCEVAIYRSIDDGSLWVRPREEFEDGRFEALTTSPAEHPAPPAPAEAIRFCPCCEGLTQPKNGLCPCGCSYLAPPAPASASPAASEAVASAIYSAYGYDPEEKTISPKYGPYGEWAKAIKAAEAVAALALPQQGWRDMSSAPKDGTLVLLNVKPRGGDDGWTPFDDSWEPYTTIGFNNLADTDVDEWQFAGWDWSFDCFRDGRGEILGWMPLPYGTRGTGGE